MLHRKMFEKSTNKFNWKILTFASMVGVVLFIGYKMKIEKKKVEYTNQIISLEDLDIEVLKYILHGIFTTKIDICKNKTFFGRTSSDGGYSVCTEGSLKPNPASCKVLSFGINGEWSFDEGIASASCYVHSFDPSMKVGDHMHKPTIQFHNLGLGKDNQVAKNGWKMRNIMTVLKDIKWENEEIDVIKCDAEGAEWPFLEDVLENKIKVKQIILEVHSYKEKPHKHTKEDYLYMISLFVRLKESGYVIWNNIHHYSCCTRYSPLMPTDIPEKCCYELYLYNSKYK